MMWLDQRKCPKSSFKNWKVTYQYMVLARGRANLSSRSSSQTRRENHLQTRLLIAEFAEQDMVRENAPRMEKLATIARDRIISKICAGHERKFMGLKKKPKNTTATQTCLLEQSPPKLKFKMMNVLLSCQCKDVLHDLS